MNCKRIIAVSVAITSLISAEPLTLVPNNTGLMANTGDELIDSAINDFQEGNVEKYGEFAPS